ncbi:hypothetical protein D3C87_1669580 [compost metagenome]
MKFFTVVLMTMVSSSAFASLAYDCKVKDLSTTTPLESVVLDLSGSSPSKVINSVALSSGKHKVTVELYFQNIQIHITDELDHPIVQSTAPDTTSLLKASLSGVASVICKRIN